MSFAAMVVFAAAAAPRFGHVDVALRLAVNEDEDDAQELVVLAGGVVRDPLPSLRVY